MGALARVSRAFPSAVRHRVCGSEILVQHGLGGADAPAREIGARQAGTPTALRHPERPRFLQRAESLP
jgi:hypothetical protein